MFETHHIEDHGGLSAAVAAAAIDYYFLFFEGLNFVDLHGLYFTEREEDTADVEVSIFMRLTHVYEV